VASGAFLAIQAPQVNKAWSMFSSHYLAVYLTIAAVITLGVLLSLGLYVQQRRDARQHSLPARRPRWAAAPEESRT